jgi:hypothetical protein
MGKYMKHLMTALVLSLAAMAGSALAADAAPGDTMAKKPNSQNTKMAMCQKSATDAGKAGPDKQAFVSECLKNKPAAAAAPMTPKEAQSAKMKACNTGSAGKTGDARKAYMSECMKKPAA